MSNTTSNSNIYRKVRALVAKTVANGCTAGEAVAAANAASRIIRDHGLDASLIQWPAAPAGFAWNGEPGKGGQMEKLPEAPKPKATKAKDEKPKPPRKRKPAEPKPPRQTKAARVVEMLKRKQGVTIEQLMAEFGILAHSARAQISVQGRGHIDYDRATKVYRWKV